MEQFTQLVDQVSGFIWNNVLLFLLVGTGVLFSVRTRFVQIRHFGDGLKHLFGSFRLKGEEAGKEGMSSFQASPYCRPGGNRIAGRHRPICPGAIFWMWLSAFGMSITWETLAKSDIDADGSAGQPAYYIRARWAFENSWWFHHCIMF